MKMIRFRWPSWCLPTTMNYRVWLLRWWTCRHWLSLVTLTAFTTVHLRSRVLLWYVRWSVERICRITFRRKSPDSDGEGCLPKAPLPVRWPMKVLPWLSPMARKRTSCRICCVIRIRQSVPVSFQLWRECRVWRSGLRTVKALPKGNFIWTVRQ